MSPFQGAFHQQFAGIEPHFAADVVQGFAFIVPLGLLDDVNGRRGAEHVKKAVRAYK